MAKDNYNGGGCPKILGLEFVRGGSGGCGLGVGVQLNSNMSLGSKTVTLSMDSLNKLYFQFFERYVTPHLIKTVAEISQLLRQRSAYDVHRFLEDLLKHQEGEGSSSVATAGLSASTGSLTLGNGSVYQYALPTAAEPKMHYEHVGYYEKTQEKKEEDSMSFKNKMGFRRTLTGLAYEETAKAYDFKNYNDDQYSQNIFSTAVPPANTTDYKADYSMPKDPLSFLPSLGKLQIIEQAQPRNKLLKDIVRRISKVFNEQQLQIEKHHHRTDTNKLFNLNISTKLDKKDEGVRIKEYQFHTKSESTRKF